jgi:hypothetical protein
VKSVNAEEAPAVQIVHFDITGVSPLVMHNIQMADPTNKLVREIKALTSRPAKQKTDEDIIEIARLEFIGGLYGPDEAHDFIYVPTWNIIRSFETAARQWRQGATVIKALAVTGDAARLEFGGPHDPAKLWADKRYSWTTSVGIQRAKTQRTRPIFRQWELQTDFVFDDEVLDLADLERAAIRAGRVEGLGDGRKLGRGRYDIKMSSRPA